METNAAKNLLVLGLPGAGKTTLSEQLGHRFGSRVVSIGGLLRELAESSEGAVQEQTVNSGGFVCDDLVVELLQANCPDKPGAGYILDGFPRTVGQVRRLGSINPSFNSQSIAALVLIVREEDVRSRLLTCGDPVRRDDHEAAIGRRISLFFASIDGILTELGALGVAIHYLDATVDPVRLARTAGDVLRRH